MKIATWNVNSIRTRLDHIKSWIEIHNPDVLSFQETKVRDEDFPEEYFRGLGYNVYYSGQKSYNGVATITKMQSTDIVDTFPGYDEEQRRFLGLTVGDVRILNVYVPNGSDTGTEKYAYKLNWMASFAPYVASELHSSSKLAIVGDFNIAPDDLDVFDPKKCAGQLLCSEPERFALKELMAEGFIDTYRSLLPDGRAFSWWDYRGGAFRLNQGFRIDLILASSALMETCQYCEIDREPRMLEKPSDHAPVIANFAL
jgi:exodeoxyribonuclease-3